ncbi:histone H1 [Mucilaginibacter gilvus]|nr:histone H1 [Mucilaginibacter gilvus]
MAKFAQLKSLIENAEQDAEKFYGNNNHAAGTRLETVYRKLNTLPRK